MAPHDIIDLCISTDDEDTKAGDKPSSRHIDFHPTDANGSAFDDFVDIDHEPRKKRRLSPVVSARREDSVTASSRNLLDTTTARPSKKASEQFLSLDNDDPTVWTSSPKHGLHPEPASPYVDQRKWMSLSDSDEDLPDEQWLLTAQHRTSKSQKAARSPKHPVTGTKSTKTKDALPRRKDKADPGPDAISPSESSENDTIPRAPKSRAARKPKLTEDEKTARRLEKEEARTAAKAIKAKEKDEEKERKRLLKEQQALTKQKEKDRAEANKLKLDKKLSTPEMIVDLPISIDGSTVDTQIRELLRQLGVEVTSYQSPSPNLIKWRRKVESRFNAEKGYREKLQTKEIDPEKHVMCLISATELADLVASDVEGDGDSLDEHVACIRSAFGGCIPIYMIEGLDAWIRKNRNARNRAYTAAVLGKPDDHNGESARSRSTATSKRQKQRGDVVDEDMMEDALLRLQVRHNCLIHHAAASVETAEWVAHFTEQISQIPYRREQMARESTFCMDSGQVKSGKDPEEVYINMLLANVRVTAPIAYGIAAKYPNVAALVRGLEEKGPMALERLKKCANRDGSVADRDIGPAISRRLYKVFTEMDPSSTDV
ncbi:MAG: hypothetical protein Q9219_001802 [cf. Caloplaca sp. 3 TL-2023]